MRVARTISEAQMLEETNRITTVVAIICIVTLLFALGALIGFAKFYTEKGYQTCISKGYSEAHCQKTK